MTAFTSKSAFKPYQPPIIPAIIVQPRETIPANELKRIQLQAKANSAFHLLRTELATPYQISQNEAAQTLTSMDETKTSNTGHKRKSPVDEDSSPKLSVWITRGGREKLVVRKNLRTEGLNVGKRLYTAIGCPILNDCHPDHCTHGLKYYRVSANKLIDLEDAQNPNFRNLIN